MGEYLQNENECKEITKRKWSSQQGIKDKNHATQDNLFRRGGGPTPLSAREAIPKTEEGSYQGAIKKSVGEIIEEFKTIAEEERLEIIGLEEQIQLSDSSNMTDKWIYTILEEAEADAKDVWP